MVYDTNSSIIFNTITGIFCDTSKEQSSQACIISNTCHPHWRYKSSITNPKKTLRIIFFQFFLKIIENPLDFFDFSLKITYKQNESAGFPVGSPRKL